MAFRPLLFHYISLHFGVISAHHPVYLGCGAAYIHVLCVMGPGSLEVLHVIFWFVTDDVFSKIPFVTVTELCV